MAGEPARGVTLQSIAQAAGVSVSSVSRVLTGRGDLKRETRERVLEAARELHYDPTGVKRGRPTALDPRLIELVLGSFDDAWTDAVTTGAREAAFRLGFDLVLTLERDDPADDWPTRVATRRPSGVIIGIIRPTQRQLDQLRGLRIPIVLLEPRSDPHGELASVGTTDWQGGYDAGVHLIESQVAHFVVVTGTPAYRFGRAREEGFRQAVTDHAPGSLVDHIDGQWTDAVVTEEMLKTLGAAPTPTGVFACNDEMAFAVYRAAKRLGRRIPADVRVVGFNDEPRAAAARPPLTSVRQPVRDMAGRAVELVKDIRLRDDDHFERVELPCTLVVRGSSRAKAAGERRATRRQDN